MNDRPDAQTQQGRLAEQLSQTLGAAGDALEFTTDPVAVKARGNTRRRRRRGLYGVATVSVVALGIGVVLRAGNGEDLSVATADQDVAETDDDEAAASADDAEAVDDTATPAGAAEQTAPAVSVADSATPPLASDVAAEMIDETLVPWQDGFLSIGTRSGLQSLPHEFMEAVSELPPQDVRDVFPDGIPATIEEATAMLIEAGLLSDTVSFSERPPPTPVARFTTDGESWETIETVIPIDGYPNVTTAGGAIVAWSVEEADIDLRGRLADPDDVRSMTVARTFDLMTWEVTDVELSASVSEQPYVTSHVWVHSLAATPTGWVALVSTEQMIDYLALLPDDLPFSADTDYVMGESDDGIEIDFWNDETGSWDTIAYSWGELGVDAADLADFPRYEPPQMFIGAFDSTSTIIASPPGVGHVRQLVATRDGVVVTGEGVHFSDDLRSWQPILELPDDTWISSAAPVDGGTLLIGNGPDPSAWLLTDGATVTDVPMPELPGWYDVGNEGRSAAWVVEIEDADEADPWEPTTLVIEREGFSIELTDGPEEQHAIVTDVSTGEVVLDRQWPYESDGTDDVYEMDQETGESAMVLRTETGAEIVRIPGDVLDDAYVGQRPPPDGAPTPDFWLLATANGVDWLVQDLDDPDPNGSGFWPGPAVINGDRVLYRTTTGWALTTL